MKKDKWYISEVCRKIDERIERNLDRIGVFLQGEVVESFGSGGAPGSGGTKGKLHSSPGEPPYVQSGMLRRSIIYERDGKNLLIGSTLQPQNSKHSYAWYLEMGTGRMRPRPYLRTAVRNNRNMIKKMLAGK